MQQFKIGDKEMVNIIFDDHEAQLKAKESDLERQDGS